MEYQLSMIRLPLVMSMALNPLSPWTLRARGPVSRSRLFGLGLRAVPGR